MYKSIMRLEDEWNELGGFCYNAEWHYVVNHNVANVSSPFSLIWNFQ